VQRLAAVTDLTQLTPLEKRGLSLVMLTQFHGLVSSGFLRVRFGVFG